MAGSFFSFKVTTDCGFKSVVLCAPRALARLLVGMEDGVLPLVNVRVDYPVSTVELTTFSAAMHSSKRCLDLAKR
jgi:hypothetical protein